MESKLIIEKQNLCFEEFKTGKISLGKIHADEVLSDMVKLKRIASIKTFIKQIRNFGVTDKNISKYEKITEYLQGYSKQNIGQIDWHIDHYKTSKEILKKYLIDCEIWKKKQLHLCYEYILSYGCDIEIENKITEQSLRQHISSENVEKTSKVLEKLNCNYDQIAYELISGSRESTETDEAAIINGLKLIDLETLEIGGKDFVTAFRFLGMEEVVVYICERLLQTKRLTCV
jgi:Uri superfamily endonuclease